MQVAFYAPMKSPRHTTPSGDRRMAQLLIRALEHGGHRVQLASEHRAYDGTGDEDVQTRIKQEADRQALALLDACNDSQLARPDVWFTYHLYHKAPDWIGPRISEALGIPYIVAEASFAAKQAGGPWGQGLQASKQAMEMADRVISFNRSDDDAVAGLLKPSAKIEAMPAFVDTRPYAQAARDWTACRARAAAQYNLPPDVPWLLCVAMMRPGDKLRSYRILGKALGSILDRDWLLLVVGDGTARAGVEAALATLEDRVHWLGIQDTDSLPGLYAASDLYVWPAVNEAFGMTFVEAQASGLPVVAGDSRDSGGVRGVVRAPDCGTLVRPDDPPSFARALCRAVADLLDDPDRRRTMGKQAEAHAGEYHGLDKAAVRLDQILKDVMT